MIFRLFYLGAIMALFVSPTGQASAATGLELAKAKNCMACHQVEAKRVGPAYQNVAQRYAGQTDAVEKLSLSIHKGSVRKWGAIPMPAQPAVSEAEARELAQWILSLKK